MPILCRRLRPLHRRLLPLVPHLRLAVQPSLAAVPVHRVRGPLPLHAGRQRLPLLRHDLLLRQRRGRGRGGSRRGGRGGKGLHRRGVRSIHKVMARVAVRIKVRGNGFFKIWGESVPSFFKMNVFLLNKQTEQSLLFSM